MTIFDYLVLLVLICSIVISTLRGLVKEVLSLASWIVALIIANAYSTALAKMLPNMIPGTSIKLIVAFIALFIGVRLVMALISKALEELIKVSGFSVADRGLGGVFGLARGIVIILAIVLLCGTTTVPQQAFWKNALFSPLAETAANTIKPYLPGQFARHINF